MAAEAKVERSTCWIDKELIRMAKVTAELEGKGKSGSDVIEEELASLRRRYRKAFDREHADLGGEG